MTQGQKIVICCILLLGVVRFSYAITKSDLLFRPTYSQQVYNRMQDTDAERRWGPTFIIVMKGVKAFVPASYVPFTWRILLLIAYGVIIYFLVTLISDFKSVFRRTTTHLWSFVLIFLALQFTGTIYNISNGGGKIFTALSIVGQFYYFYKKKYFLAAIFIICGIYFQLFPIVFAFPYFVFSICSKRHRRYALYLVLIGAVVSLISLPVQGWKYGLLYPFSILFSIMGQTPNILIIWSRETLAPISFINKIINGFQVTDSYIPMTHSVTNIAFVLTILLVGTNIFAGWKLSRFENRWQHNAQLRLLHLFIFQVFVGFIFLTFSLEMSIEGLLLSVVSLFAPMFLFSAHIHKVSDMNRFQIKCMVGFLIGLCLVGGLLPLSILNRILPLDWIHQIAGNPPDNLKLYEKYIWYHIPMFGIYIIAFVFYKAYKASVVGGYSFH